MAPGVCRRSHQYERTQGRHAHRAGPKVQPVRPRKILALSESIRKESVTAGSSAGTGGRPQAASAGRRLRRRRTRRALRGQRRRGGAQTRMAGAEKAAPWSSSFQDFFPQEPGEREHPAWPGLQGLHASPPAAAEKFGATEILTVPGGRFRWSAAGSPTLAVGPQARRILAGARDRRALQKEPPSASRIDGAAGDLNINFLGLRPRSALRAPLRLLPVICSGWRWNQRQGVDREGRAVDYATAPVLFGIGTRAAHLQQLLLQGPRAVRPISSIPGQRPLSANAGAGRRPGLRQRTRNCRLTAASRQPAVEHSDLQEFHPQGSGPPAGTRAQGVHGACLEYKQLRPVGGAGQRLAQNKPPGAPGMDQKPSISASASSKMVGGVGSREIEQAVDCTCSRRSSRATDARAGHAVIPSLG